MTVINKQLISDLNKIETLWTDDEQRLKVAIQYSEASSEASSTLKKMISCRNEFQEQVQERIQAYGNSPPSGISLRRRIRKVLTAAETVLHTDSLAINLEECLEGAIQVKKHLKNLDLQEYPRSITQLLNYQLRILEADIQSLRELYKSQTGRKFVHI